MIREIKLIIPSNPGNGQFFKVNIEVDGISYNQQFTFKTTPSISTDILIGANVTDTRVNTFTAFNNFASSKVPQYSAVQNSDGASIFIDADDVDSGNVFPWFNIVGFSVTHTTISLGIPKTILSRSPYFVDTNASGNFDRSELELKIWTGHRTINKPAVPTYSMSKSVVQAGQDNVVFDIHKLVNDRVRGYFKGIDNTGVFSSNLDESVWVEVVVTAFFDNVLAGTTTRQFLAIDGFGYHREGFNPQVPKVMSSITDHIFYGGVECPLYFSTEGLASIKVNGVDQGFLFDNDLSNQNFGYIDASNFPTVNGVNTVAIEYDNYGTFTHRFKAQEGCKDVINCVFKNKFGFWQSFPFAMRHRTSLERSSENYKGVISSFGRYDKSRHNNIQFNTAGKRKHNLNTDYLPDNYNVILEQLMLSEFVYLVIDDVDGQIIPVDLVAKSIQFKTKQNEGLIQYAMEFEESYNVINQVI